MDRQWLYAGLLIAGGITIAKALQAGPVVRRGERLLLVGDSLAVGLAPVLGQLAKDNGVVFDSAAKTGSRIAEWAPGGSLNASLQQKLAARPKVVLISLGTNDEALSQQAAAAEVPKLDALIALVKASGAELGWIGPPFPLPFAANGITTVIRSKVPASHYFASENFTIPRAGDRLHPTVKGYAGWAGQIWPWLRCCS